MRSATKRMSWTESNKPLIEQVRQELENKRGVRKYGRKSTYDPANPDHLLLDAFMPKEEASEIRYLNFGKIWQPWLKELARKFIRVRSSSNTRSQLKAHLQGFQFFSTSLLKAVPDRRPEDLNRDDILDFLSAMARANLRPQSRTMYLGTMKNFLETCAFENWGGIQNKFYVFLTDFPKKAKHQPKAIPESVMAQIDQMVTDMPGPLARKVIVLRDTGMRISELLALPFDCLVKESTKIVGLRYMIWKLKKEHQIPISQAVIDAVTAQQEDLILKSKKRGTPLSPYLFPAPDGDRYHSTTIRQMLKTYAKKHKIRDHHGKPFNFHPHQLRHTLATRMINNGVPHHFIQKHLGHETSIMVASYAEVNDHTKRVEFEKYQGRIINIYGQVVDASVSPDANDLKWLAKNINAQALPNGYCGIPVIMSDCPTANSCLTCTHFRTDKNFLPQHEAQLAETIKILENAQEKGWIRQIETNAKVKASLEKMVTALKLPGEQK
jgi:integrase/recombinase XerD